MQNKAVKDLQDKVFTAIKLWGEDEDIQQIEAEKEGRLDEFIAEQERLATVRSTTTCTPFNDADYLVQQIQAMKEKDTH